MSIQDFLKNFANQFEETDSSVFTKDTVFKNLDEWSSLMALSIIAMCDEAYDVTLKGDDISNSNTIEDLFNLVKSRA